MKIALIGINRYSFYLNFAGNLHAYAFQQFLAQHGYESTILNYKPVHHGGADRRWPADYAEEKYRDAILAKARTPRQNAARRAEREKWAKLAIGYRSAAEERARRHDKFDAFIAAHLRYTERVYDSDLLEFEDPGFDCYLCVSDIIWRRTSIYTFDRGFLLGSRAFEGKKKISYAASRGLSKDFSKRDAKQFFRYLEDFDAISVRERDFSEYIERNSAFAASTVLDPVLLHDREFWARIAVKPPEERFLLLYYVTDLAEDTIKKAVEYAKAHDLTVVELSERPLKYGAVTDPDVRHISRHDIGPDEWLGYIEHAEVIFTNSFHGCCFAFLFGKPFFVGPRDGSKLTNFFTTFDLADRRVLPEDDVKDLSLTVDFAPARALLEQQRAHSRDFILTALRTAEQTVVPNGAIDRAKYEARRRGLTYPIRFSSGHTGAPVYLSRLAPKLFFDADYLDDDSLEYEQPLVRCVNDGSARVRLRNLFRVPGHRFAGWTLRFRIDNRWFWWLKDGSFAEGDAIGAQLEIDKAVIGRGARLPHFPVNHISTAVLVARWHPHNSPLSRVRRRTGPLLSLPGRALRTLRRGR